MNLAVLSAQPIEAAPSGRSVTGATAGSTDMSTADGLGTTFLNLLSTELKNQDPTAPMDSTAMVGQMISLNQLNQLIAINKKLDQPTTNSAASVSTAAAMQSATHKASHTSPSEPASAANAQQVVAPAPLPFDPQTMMPLDFSHPGGLVSNAAENVQ